MVMSLTPHRNFLDVRDEGSNRGCMKHYLWVTILAAGLHAAEPSARVPVLAELFTSEGCSSCPPADALLMKLDKMQPVAGAQIIVLSEHVDYWNSLGWSDPYSSAQFTQRQGMYTRESYTPEMVIDGRKEVLGSDEKAIQAAVAKAVARPKLPVRIVSARRDDNEAVVSVSPVISAAAGKSGRLWSRHRRRSRSIKCEERRE